MAEPNSSELIIDRFKTIKKTHPRMTYESIWQKIKDANNGHGVSERTLKSIYKSHNPRVSPRVLGCLEKFLISYDRENIADGDGIYDLLNRKIGSGERLSKKFIEHFGGHYNHCRITTDDPPQLLVTKLYIYGDKDTGVSRFSHQENEPQIVGPYAGELLSHDGVVLIRNSNLNFLSIGNGTLRQIRAKVHSEKPPMFLGILSAVNAHDDPFASKVLIYRSEEDFDAGTYAADDPQVGWIFEKYLKPVILRVP